MAIGNIHKKLVKTVCVVLEICLPIDRQTGTHRHTRHNTSAPCYGGELITFTTSSGKLYFLLRPKRMQSYHKTIK